MIEVSHLVKKYGNHYAVNDLDFTVERGQIYGFLGPNGAGKSTTMNIITGYLAATSGTVKVNGFDIVKQPEEAKKRMGYLPEIPPLYPDMTVGEYLNFVAELKKVKKEDRKNQINEIMEETHITDVQSRLIKNLSKGYKQRVGLAQAMIGYPDVIILDEPTVGLDPKQIIEIRDLIKNLKEKHTVILSSHILSEVSAICDHILIISKGKLVASDSPEGLSRLMSGEDKIELEIKGNKTDVENILNSIPEISTCETDYQPENGITKAEITVKSKAEIREQLCLEFAKKNLPIYKLLLTTKSLEDIFLELTQEEPVIEETEDLNETEDSKETDHTEGEENAEVTGQEEK